MSLGPAEILVVLVLALIIFGPKRLPEVGRQVGGALRELRKVQDTVQSEIRTVLDDTAPPVRRMSPANPPAAIESQTIEPQTIEPQAIEPGPGEPDLGDEKRDIEGLSGGTFS